MTDPSDVPTAAAAPARRRLLGFLGLLGAGALSLWSCGGGSSADDGSSTDTTGDGSSSGGGTSTSETCPSDDIPGETTGPYPADGGSASGQTLNALALSGIVRSDLRDSIDGASGTAAGLETTVTLTLVDVADGCSPLAGLAVYLWHCTADGGYSLYGSGLAGENFLRGVQVSDEQGQVRFTTIFPGCYSGRWPHMHFEIYASLAAAIDATAVRDYLKVTQLAVPAAACAAVYGTVGGYEASVANFAAISLASDNVFGDDEAALQLASASGSATEGYALSLTVGLQT